MLTTTKHLRCSNIVASGPKSKCEFFPVLGNVERSNDTILDQRDAVMTFALTEQKVTVCIFAPTPQFMHGL